MVIVALFAVWFAIAVYSYCQSRSSKVAPLEYPSAHLSLALGRLDADANSELENHEAAQPHDDQ